MIRKRRRHSEQFKFKVALEAAKGQRMISELASAHRLRDEIHDEVAELEDTILAMDEVYSSILRS